MNKIAIELCAEDRARLDKLTAALEKVASGAPVCIGVDIAKTEEGEDEVARAAREALKNAPEELEKIDPPAAPEAEETPTETEEAKPTVTLAQIQQKVVQLAAGFNGSKKAKVREIINAYAKKVSDLPEDKWAEVWAKLNALESEE